MHARRSEGEQPADIRRGDKVPGGAQNVRAQDRAGIKCLFDGSVADGRRVGVQAHAERPLGAGIVLGLGGAQPVDDLGRVPESRG